jgi:hypothetical protein
MKGAGVWEGLIHADITRKRPYAWPVGGHLIDSPPSLAHWRYSGLEEVVDLARWTMMSLLTPVSSADPTAAVGTSCTPGPLLRPLAATTEPLRMLFRHIEQESIH